MSATAEGIQFKVGLDSSELAKGFDHSLRFAGDFVNGIKKALSVRGLFDGFAGAIASAFGGNNLGEVFSKAVHGALGKEQDQQKFEGMMGNAEDAKGMIKRLGEFASEAHIARDEVISAARVMFGKGLNDGRVLQDMRKLGEITTALGVPFKELSDVWAEMFTNGSADIRELMTLERGMNIPIIEALAKTTGESRDQIKAMGAQGSITIPMMEKAFDSLTGAGGRFFGQIERRAQSGEGLLERMMETLGKIPTAFFSGIIDVAEGPMKNGLKAVTAMLEGWVKTAKDFGAQIAKNLEIVGQLYRDGKLWETMKSGFAAAVGFLTQALAAAASGFISGMMAGVEEIGDAIAAKMNPFGGDRKPTADVMAHIMEATKGGAIAGWNGGDFGLGDSFAKLIADAKEGLKAPRPGDKDFIGPLWNPTRREIEDGYHPKTPNEAIPPLWPHFQIESNALQKIGLATGAGGPQAEAHARVTAKNTERIANAADQMANKLDIIASRKPGVFV